MTSKLKNATTLLFCAICLSICDNIWSQSSDFIVYPTLTFYASDTPTVADLTVREQSITGTIVWYNQKVGGTAYNSGDALDPNQSYWAELSGASIGSRLQTKIYFANTPVISPGDGITLNTSDSQYYVCENENFTLNGENLGGLEEFEATLNGLGFTRLDTGLNNGNAHFINNTANTWVYFNNIINGDPNVSSSVGTPGVSMYMFNDPVLANNQTERDAVWNAIVAAGLDANFYWMGMSQFLNSNEYAGTTVGTQSRADAGWFWEDGTYYNRLNPINAAGDWNNNEPNDFGTDFFNLEEDKLQVRNNRWVDQVGNSTVAARRSGAIIEFNDASGIQWYRNEGLGWVLIPGATGTELTDTAGVSGTSIEYRVDATFNGSPQSATFTVNVASLPSTFNIVDNDDSNNPNEAFYVCDIGDTRVLKTDIPAGALNFTWTANPSGVVNLTPTGNTVTVEGVASGAVTITCTANNANGCEYTTSIMFEVSGLSTPTLANPFGLCGNSGDELPTTDNNGQEIAWYATGDTATELSGDAGVSIIDGQAYDVYGVVRDLNGDVVCQSTNSTSITIDLPYVLETDPTLPDPNNGNPGPIEWSLGPSSAAGNFDLRNLGRWSPVSTIGTNRYYTLFRGVNPSTLPEAPYELRVYRNSNYTNQISSGIQSYNTSLAGNPDIIYATITPDGFDCTYNFGPIYLRDCIAMDLGNEITGGNEICQVGSSIQLNADVTNLPAGYTISWSATSGSPAGNVTFDDDTASSVTITGTVVGDVNISYTITDPSGTQCETTTRNSFVVSVIDPVTPTFDQVPDICSGDSLSPLPSTSNEGITGSWLPVLNNSATTTYTFIPNAGQCATRQTMTITVKSIVTPTFDQVPDICVGDSLSDLPMTSNENITGSWLPVLNNSATTTYTFTPNAGECATTQTMTITVLPLPVANGITASSVTSVCSTNDTAIIEADGTIGTNYQISWTQNNSNVNIVPNPSNEREITVTALADAATTDITYRITNTSTIDPISNPEGCYSEYTFTFEINTPNTPIADAQQLFCESGFVSDLVATVDVSNNEELVWLDASDVEIPASNWATTALVSGAVYKAVARNTISNCESNTFSVTANIENRLIINPTNADLDRLKCYDGVNLPVFDLTENDPLILGTESDTDFDIGYFTDAGRVDRIIDPTNFVNSTSNESQTIYVRVFTRAITDNSCYADAEFTVINSLEPQISVTNFQPLCDGETINLTIDAADGTYDYTWVDNMGVLVVAPSIPVSTDGIYNVFATNTITGCISDIETIEVRSSGAPSIDQNDIRVIIKGSNISDIIIDNTANNLGLGDYRFALDNGAFQDEPIFENVASGIHQIRVNDKNGCGPDAVIERYVFGFPKFFTPNGDDTNDYWQVKGLDTRFYQHSSISVFNRYGKLLKVFSTANQGWDGTFNGVLLPSEDYWYTMVLTDVSGNRSLLKGHFTLKH
ncbi:hypothetical protein MHTCC0001_09140 [Flavobacteriaceae bacterium MHTCC 0001]